MVLTNKLDFGINMHINVELLSKVLLKGLMYYFCFKKMIHIKVRKLLRTVLGQNRLKYMKLTSCARARKNKVEEL